METCRFLTKDSTCQIGQLAIFELDNEAVAAVVGDVIVPSRCDVTPVQAENRPFIFLTPICSASEKPLEQRNCDTFVAEKHMTRDQWLSNFQEG